MVQFYLENTFFMYKQPRFIVAYNKNCTPKLVVLFSKNDDGRIFDGQKMSLVLGIICCHLACDTRGVWTYLSC